MSEEKLDVTDETNNGGKPDVTPPVETEPPAPQPEPPAQESEAE